MTTEYKNRLEQILLPLLRAGEINSDELIAIVASVDFVAKNDCPTGFGTRWHNASQELVKSF